MGLGLYVLLETLIFAPLLLIATAMSGADSLILSAATISVGLFCGLTLLVFMTGTDFSFLRGALIVGSVVAVAVIIASIFIGFNLGLIFSAVMVLLVAGTILYQTSNIIYRYHSSQYVAASLGLFSSFMLLFWYVLRILMSLRD